MVAIDPELVAIGGGILRHQQGRTPRQFNTAGPDDVVWLALDARLQGRSGLDFQRELNAANVHTPIIRASRCSFAEAETAVTSAAPLRERDSPNVARMTGPMSA
jgi:hypothetical protein